jgi:RNA polymerase sigma factor (sigma-70 family)
LFRRLLTKELPFTAVTDQPKQNIISAVREYGKRLSLFIRGKVDNDEVAEDILQDVWYRFTKVMNTEPIEQVSGWLYRVAKNRIIDSYRNQKNIFVSDDDLDDEDLTSQELFTVFSNIPEKENLSELFWEKLGFALDELPAEQRDVFIWNELDEIPFHKIAERTGEKINTLISRKRYAVIHLRKRLEGLYKEIIQH